MQYFTDVSTRGRVLYRKIPSLVGVFESPDCLLMIGTARKVGRTGDDMSIWSLRVRLADIPGRWNIIDGKFVPVEDSQPSLNRTLPVEHPAMRIQTSQAIGKAWNVLRLLGFLGVLRWPILDHYDLEHRRPRSSQPVGDGRRPDRTRFIRPDRVRPSGARWFHG